MSFALGVLVMASLSPLSMSNTVLGQKVEVIKGKKVNRTASKPAPELQPQTVTDNSQQNAKSAELDKKAAALDAKEKQLAAKEAALDEKQQDASAAEKAKNERQQKQLKQIEKIAKDNQAGFENATDALTGE